MHTNLPSSLLLDHPPPPKKKPSHLRPQIVQHPQRYFTPSRRIPTNQSPATIVAFLLTTAGITLPLFLLLTLRTAVSFHVGLFTLFHPWLAANHLYLMALIPHFILKLCFLFFERSSASVSEAWFMPFVLSLPTSMLSSGPTLKESQYSPWSHCTLRRRPGAYTAR